jgi:hypothetical protein
VAHGVAVEVLELARQHRVAEHPELRERGTRPKPKTPVKHPSVQTEEDKRIVRDIAERRRAKTAAPKRASSRSAQAAAAPRRLLTDAMLDEATRRHVAGGESLLGIARERYVAWGFLNPKSCAVALSRDLRGRGVQIRPRTETTRTPAPSRLTPERVAACAALYTVGFSTTAIGELVWERYGYASRASAGVSIAVRLREAGVLVGRRPPGVRSLGADEAAAVIEAADRPPLEEAA